MMLRSDLQIITELIAEGSKVLDLGCGDGALLESLVQKKKVRGRGIELSEAGVLACVKRGLSVRQGDLEEGLADYPDASFDYVILSQTLPFVDNPGRILNEMLRVGRQAIVSFSNWGYWRCRLYLLTTGRIPQAPDLPQAWYDTPRWQAFTSADFGQFCQQHYFKISRQVYLSGNHRYTRRRFKNLLSTTAIFCLENGELPK
ncbi:MAG: methionine biosynthesis protein MetW [Anaerolineae bacterium]|nr:methionine biosynthesis protein MetW [Anaerolineae bacterium]